MLAPLKLTGPFPRPTSAHCLATPQGLCPVPPCIVTGEGQRAEALLRPAGLASRAGSTSAVCAAYSECMHADTVPLSACLPALQSTALTAPCLVRACWRDMELLYDACVLGAAQRCLQKDMALQPLWPHSVTLSAPCRRAASCGGRRGQGGTADVAAAATHGAGRGARPALPAPPLATHTPPRCQVA